MSFLGLGQNYNRPGPGIPKDMPKKKGAALFFEIVGREFWSLFTLNFIYILACIPIITIGPATAALSRTTITMVRDQNVYPWRDFWEAFRKNLKQGFLFGIPATLFVFTAIWIDLGMVLGRANIWQMAFIFLWTFIGVALGCYIFPLVSYVSLPSFPLLKNAMFLIILGKFRTVAAVLVSIVVTALAVLYFPISIPVLLLAGIFAFLSFFTSFMVWPVIERYVINGEGQQPEAEEATEPVEASEK